MGNQLLEMHSLKEINTLTYKVYNKKILTFGETKG